MIEWVRDLEFILKIYWTITIVSIPVFTVLIFLKPRPKKKQLVKIKKSVNKPTIHYIRNFICFFIGFGWGGICFFKMLESITLLNGIAIFTGVIFVVVYNYIILHMERISIDRSFHMQYVIGKVADVKKEIPGEGQGKGKIQIRYGGNLYDINAISEDHSIPQGVKVKIISISYFDSQTVIVRIL